MRCTSISMLLVTVVGLAGCNKMGAGGGNVEPKTDDQKTFYALGFSMSQRVQVFSLKPDELAMVLQGFRDGVNNKKPGFEVQTYGMKLNGLAQTRSKERMGEEKKAAAGVLEAAAKEPGAEKLPSGLIVKTIKEGTGENPKATDRVKVHYHGTLRDGHVFDSSVERKEPATFPLNGVVPCWTEGVQKIKVGGKAKLTCPSELAYGDQGRPGIPPGAVLTFEVELLSIEAAPPPAMPMLSAPLGAPPGGPPGSPPTGAPPAAKTAPAKK
jgi:FKBP-type peptidyl-prolyl cis-trans isomerase FkpA